MADKLSFTFSKRSHTNRPFGYKWQVRYFELTPSTLSYFDKKDGHLKREIRISEITGVEPVPFETFKKHFVIQLVHDAGILYLQGKDIEEVNESLKQFREVCKNSGTAMSRSHHTGWYNKKWTCCKGASAASSGCMPSFDYGSGAPASISIKTNREAEPETAPSNDTDVVTKDIAAIDIAAKKVDSKISDDDDEPEVVRKVKKVLSTVGDSYNVTKPVQTSTIERQKRILAGRIGDADTVESTVVRVFVSSTFTDTQMERDWIMQYTNPLLRSWMQKTYGLKFQVIDMRWGVRDEATDEHQTTQLCMQELFECQKLSKQISFISLQSHKYGYRPFPSRIESGEYLKLKAEIPDEHHPLFDRWFKEDTNQIPESFVLQPINLVLGSNWRENKATKDEWWATFEKFQGLLRTAALKCLEPSAAHRYVMSVTEDEFENGVVRDPIAAERCVWLKRVIVDIDDHLDDEAAGKYVDMKWGSSERDPDAARLVDDLVSKRMKDAFEAQNVKEYKVHWAKGGMSDSIPEHRQHAMQVCEDYANFIADRVARSQHEEIPAHAQLYKEALIHLEFSRTKVKNAVQPESFVSRINGYLTAPGPSTPLVIHGDSGCGKTVAMACVLKYALESLPKAIVIGRFVGVSEASSDIGLLIRSLHEQLSLTFGQNPKDIGETVEDICSQIQILLTNATAEQPIVVVLDSLDQLNEEERARECYWLPTQLPEHVKIVVSTLEDPVYTAFPSLQAMLVEGLPEPEQGKAAKDFFYKMHSMSEDHAPVVMSTLLEEVQHSITSPQMEKVLTKWRESGAKPLYLSVAAQLAQRWKSYDELSSNNLESSISDLIVQLFKYVEKMHGNTLVSTAFAYITAARYGLSEEELFTALNSNETVKSAVFQYWTPPDGQLPTLLWTRIVRDLGGHLVKRGGMGLLGWFHRQFRQEAVSRYIGSKETSDKIRIDLTEMFEEDVREAEKKGDLAPRRAALELPWLYQQLGDMDKLRECLVTPAVFSRLKEIHNLERNYDLLRFWAATGDSHDEIGRIYIEKLKSLPDQSTERYMWLCKNVSNFLDDVGALPSAIEGLQMTMEVCKLLPGNQDRNIEVFYNDIGLIFMKRGMHDQAISYMEKSLKIYREGAPDSAECANTLQNLGAVLCDSGDFEKGHPLLLEAVEILEKLLGPLDASTGGTYFNIGRNLRREERYDEALQWYEKSLLARKTAYGPNHPDVASTIDAMGVVYMFKGRPEDAQNNFDSALKVRETLQGPDHLSVAISCFNKGNCFLGTDQPHESLPWYERACKIYQDVRGDLHQHTKDGYYKLANAHYAIGEKEMNTEGLVESAVQHFNETVRIAQEKVPEMAKEYHAFAYFRLGEISDRQGTLDQSVAYYSKSIPLFREATSPGSPAHVESMMRHANAYLNQGKFMECVPHYQKILDELADGEPQYERARHLSKLNIAHAHFLAGLDCINAGDGDGAKDLLQKAADLKSATLGEDNVDVGRCYYNLGMANKILKDFEACHTIFTKAKEVYAKALGPEHEDTHDAATQAAYGAIAAGNKDVCRTEVAAMLKSKQEANEFPSMALVGFGYSMGKMFRSFECVEDCFKYFQISLKNARALGGDISKTTMTVLGEIILAKIEISPDGLKSKALPDHNLQPINLEVLSNIICDGCDGLVQGDKHHCGPCDYDLCDDCSKTKEHEHDLEVIPGPDRGSPCAVCGKLPVMNKLVCEEANFVICGYCFCLEEDAA